MSDIYSESYLEFTNCCMTKDNKTNQHIGTRLSQFRERSNIKMPAISTAIGIPKETLYKWEHGTNPRDVNDYFKLKAYLDAVEMKEDEYEMGLEAKKPTTIRLPLTVDQPPVYDSDGRTAAGTILIFNGEPQLIVERMNAPFMGTVEGAIDVTGDSMEPTIKHGCRIAIHRLSDFRILDWGRCYYVINKNLKGIVRRVYPCEGGIQLVSDHPNKSVYPPIERSWDQIIAVLEIVGTADKL